MSSDERQLALAGFARFARSLKGDEKSEAQAFLERFFRALGHAGVLEAGASFEFRIAKKPGSSQLELLKGDEAKKSTGKKFADLLWPSLLKKKPAKKLPRPACCSPSPSARSLSRTTASESPTRLPFTTRTK